MRRTMQKKEEDDLRLDMGQYSLALGMLLHGGLRRGAGLTCDA